MKHEEGEDCQLGAASLSLNIDGVLALFKKKHFPIFRCVLCGVSRSSIRRTRQACRRKNKGKGPRVARNSLPAVVSLKFYTSAAGEAHAQW